MTSRMPASSFARSVILLAVMLCAGCTVTYPVVGRFDDFNEVLVGEVNANLLTGSSRISAAAKNSDMRCNGTSRVLHIPASNYIVPGLCKGQKGDANLSCSDGRTIKADWEALSCTRGFGTGLDQNGARFSFTFGMTQTEAVAYIENATAQVASKPSLPVYQPKEVRKEKGFATGTGFFVGGSGELVTNFHVVEDATEIIVAWNGKEFPATVLKLDSANDLALLKIAASTPALRVDSARNVVKAQEVLTLGYPLIVLTGQEQKASFGRVNALSGIQGDIRFLQIDVPIQPGNSGGPLITREGAVVGVVTATLNQLVTLRASGSLPQNINYAVKSDYLLPLLPESPIADNVEHKSLDFIEAVKQAEQSVALVISK